MHQKTIISRLQLHYEFFLRKHEVLIFTVIEICIVLSNLGNTLHFPNSKRQIGLVGMLIGCGEITG